MPFFHQLKPLVNRCFTCVFNVRMCTIKQRHKESVAVFSFYSYITFSAHLHTLSLYLHGHNRPPSTPFTRQIVARSQYGVQVTCQIRSRCLTSYAYNSQINGFYKHISIIVKHFHISIDITFLLNKDIKRVCVLKRRGKSPLQISSIQFNKPV